MDAEAHDVDVQAEQLEWEVREQPAVPETPDRPRRARKLPIRLADYNISAARMTVNPVMMSPLLLRKRIAEKTVGRLEI